VSVTLQAHAIPVAQEPSGIQCSSPFEGLVKGTTDAAKESKCMLEMESRSQPKCPS